MSIGMHNFSRAIVSIGKKYRKQYNTQVMVNAWKTTKQHYAYTGKRIRVREDEFVLPDGSTGQYELVERTNPFVVVIALVKDNYILVESYRYPMKARSLEFSMGAVEHKEEPREAAKRELLEETGYASNNWKKIGQLWLAPGHHTQTFWVFEARDCIKVQEPQREPSEADMTMMMVSRDELASRIRAHEIKDSPTVAAWGLYSVC